VLPFARPLPTNKAANATEPIKFPIKLKIHIFIESAQVTFFSSDPIVMTMLFPVKSSEPAIITRLKAIPKDAPITIFVAGDSAADNNPPIVNINKIPNPTYTPAKAAAVRYLILLFFNNSDLFTADAATLLISSLNKAYHLLI